ncbi:hypothetical protein AB0F95_21425 [Micromonospora tulbaghiae]|uniref:hypothetical protein n=1 Tax=Micromonospora tulbaghiae TaxID=479978 RepID=UPI0033EB62E8
MAAVDNRLWHWYLIPVTLCGILIAPDVVACAAKRLDLFDPQALVGLFGFHFFYLAPILHVLMDYWAPEIPPLPDWRSGLGAMAALNVFGLTAYRICVGLPNGGRVRRHMVWSLNVRRFARLGWLAFVIGLIGFAAILVRFGGPVAYLDTAADDRLGFAGQGWLLLIGESFPFIGFVVVAIRYRGKLASRPNLLTAVFLAFAAAQFLAGGLRGSRSNTIWPLLVGLVVVHLVVRPIARRTLVPMAVAFMAFMYVYGVYKSTGSEIVRAGSDGRSVVELGDETGRTLPALLLGDLGRADIQAVVLERQQAATAPLGYGLSYLASVKFLVPDTLHPEWLRDKSQLGTDMVYGEGTYASVRQSSRIYGLGGEALLNFGPAGVIVSYAVFGFAVRAARRRYALALTRTDLGAAVFSAIGGVSVILALGSDLGNVWWFMVKTGAPLAILVVLARTSRSSARDPHSPVGRISNGGGPAFAQRTPTEDSLDAAGIASASRSQSGSHGVTRAMSGDIGGP